MPTNPVTVSDGAVGTSLVKPTRGEGNHLAFALKLTGGDERLLEGLDTLDDIFTSQEVLLYVRILHGTTSKDLAFEISGSPLWKLVDAPLSWLKWRRDRTAPDKVHRYMSLATPAPAVVTNVEGIVLDGWHRCESRILARSRKIPTLLPLLAVIPDRSPRKPCFYR